MMSAGIYMSHVVRDLWRGFPDVVKTVGSEKLLNELLTSRLAKDKANAVEIVKANPGDASSLNQRLRTLRHLSRDNSPIDAGEGTVGGLALGALAALEETTEDVCFVLMPFNPEFRKNYESVFCPAIRAANLQPLRSDEIFGARTVMLDIWRSINTAAVILAEVTGQNPNVFYELGLTHAVGKPAVIVTRSMDDVPFDLKSLRCLPYDVDDPDWGAKLKVDIQRALESVRSEAHVPLFGEIP
jgi:hypothetical protein